MKSGNPYWLSVLCLSVIFHPLCSSLESPEDVIARTALVSSCSGSKRHQNGEIVCLTLMKGCNSLKGPKQNYCVIVC